MQQIVLRDLSVGRRDLERDRFRDARIARAVALLADSGRVRGEYEAELAAGDVGAGLVVVGERDVR